MSNDNLGDRMKAYEAVTQTSLMRRAPVIIRLDGKAFHTFTKGLKHVDPSLNDTPFSEVMHECMAVTAQALVNNIQNAQVAYSQSDEITILLRDWDKHETEQWFDGNIQKITSISAAIATAHFNSAYNLRKALARNHIMATDECWLKTESKMRQMEYLSEPTFAMFDARVFNVPKEDVVNNFIWRQNDAIRNSVQMLARHYFSHKELHGKSNVEVKAMIFAKTGLNWHNIPTWMRHGFCVTRDGIDREIPVFSQDRSYIAQHLFVPELETING